MKRDVKSHEEVQALLLQRPNLALQRQRSELKTLCRRYVSTVPKPGVAAPNNNLHTKKLKCTAAAPGALLQRWRNLCTSKTSCLKVLSCHPCLQTSIGWFRTSLDIKVLLKSVTKLSQVQKQDWVAQILWFLHYMAENPFYESNIIPFSNFSHSIHVQLL